MSSSKPQHPDSPARAQTWTRFRPQWLRNTLFAASLITLLLPILNPPALANSVLFLNVAPSPGGFEIREQYVRPGSLKNPHPEPHPRHLHQVKLRSDQGEWLSQASLGAAHMRVYEYPASADPAETTWAQRFVPQASSGQWIRLQVPDGIQSGQLVIESLTTSPAVSTPNGPAPASLAAPQILPLRWGHLLQPADIAPASDGSLITLRESGPRSQRINIVVASEGYRAEEQQKFIDDARMFADGLFEVEPLSNYQGLFNVYGIFVASVESGSDIPSQGIKRNTYFNSSFESYGISQLLTIPPNDRIFDPGQGSGKLNVLLRDILPDYDLAALLVNDDTYGGSGGSVLIVSTHPSAVEIARHEFGHSFAQLGDEYSDPYPGYPDVEEPNTTRETVRERIKWRDWIADSTPVPTPVGAGFEREVGLFEGAHYHATGWYRPKSICRMKVLGQPYCEVCRERLVLKTYELASSIGSWAPTNNTTVVVESQTPFHIALNRPDPDTLQVTWRWNGTPMPEQGDSLLLDATLDVPGISHTLTAEVYDSTPFIRTDRSNRRLSKLTWSVLLQPLPAPVLSVRVEGDFIVLQWPDSAQGFVLQSASTLNTGSPQFVPVGSPVTQQDGHYQSRLPLQNGARFFRLSR